ncbi:MAG: type II toxin-antitoxin system VapC family toxin [Chloroflexi bacterium]|nr:type II toxin-antitoxin system VapC family toxin [Chloroflexota bacterium]
MIYVPDASFLLRAMVPSQQLPAAQSVLSELVEGGHQFVSTNLLQSEFASNLRSLHRRGVIDTEARVSLWRAFRLLPIEHGWNDAWIERALEIAEAAGQSKIYDSLYLACAEAFGIELLTCDASFVRALGANPPSPVRLVG